MESIFQGVGSCGCFQVFHVFWIQLIRIINVWAVYLMVFGNYEPPWQCVKNPQSDNATSVPQNAEIVYGKDFETIFNNLANLSSAKNLSQTSNSTLHNYTSVYLEGTCARLPYCDDVRFDRKSVTLVTEFGLICDKSFVPSIILAVQMLGMLCGSTVGGQVGEQLGRKVNVYLSLAVMSAGLFVASWSTSWEMYAGFTFFIGLGGGGIMATHIMYAMEFLTPKWRGRFGALPVWNISLFIFALVIIGLKNWRYIHMLCGGIAAFFLLGVFWVPESLRWLHVHGKEAKVKKVIKQMMKYNRRKGDVSQVLSKLMEKTANTKDTERKYTYLDLFRTSNMCAYTLKASVVWFSSHLSYYTLGYSIKSYSGDFYTNLFISCVSEIPFVLLVGPCVNKLGRRVTICLSMSLATILSLVAVVAYYAMDYSTAGTVIKYAAIPAKGFANISVISITILTNELYPTPVRSLAMGFLNTVARIGSIIAAFLIPRGHESLSICFIILSGALLAAAIIVMSLPETKNKPLEDHLLVVTKNDEEKVQVGVEDDKLAQKKPDDSLSKEDLL